VGPQTWQALIVSTSQGSTGPAVEALQRQLNANGENVSVDSNFGPLTNQAVRDFQSSRGLGVDGTAGPQTWNALVNNQPPVTSSSWPTESQGSSGENVYSIQLLLQARGYSLSIDGDFGPGTAAAVKAFQSAHSLGVDGVVGPRTWQALIISTSQGSSGSAVTALQRQLNAHGQSVGVDGNFGPLTEAAVRSYQSSNGLGVDGIAGPQTWQSLVSTSGSSQVPPPPPPPSGSTLWGFDATDPITSSYLSTLINARGRPDFIGRYIDAISWTPMQASEAAYIHSQGIHIMVLDSSITTNDTTYSTGVWMANRVIAKAQALGIPAGVAIFSDIENTSSVDAAFIEGWYDTISASGYKPGYYANPLAGSSQFSSAFCTAISSNANIASQSILWPDEPSIGWTTKANAPAFAPAIPYCNGRAVGNVLAWQYALPGGGLNIDSDELKSSVPLW
jgi:peptidoglycan hydrolase-like protein with peptidoglycan-binding domain